MKKNIIPLLALAMVMAAAFMGCKRDRPEPDPEPTPTEVAVTGVTLNPAAPATLTIGGAPLVLTATVAPDNADNKAVTWNSSNTAAATVSSAGNSATVTAVAAGTATITVTTTDGNKTATCAVTVKAATVAVTDVSLNKTAETLFVDQQFTLTPTVLPETAANQAVTWASSDDAVAEVDNGTVTAVAEGTAVITVTTQDGNHTATCEVTVIVPVTDVTLSQATAELIAGDEFTLTPAFTPSNATNQAVTWSSNNTAVATVDSGTVTAIAYGTATITVTTEDGGKTADCAVTVTVPVASVSLNKTTATLGLGNAASVTTLTPAVLPAEATNKAVSWSSSHPAVATVAGDNTGATVTAVAPGEAIITVTTVNGEQTATCAVAVHNLIIGSVIWADVNVDDYKTFAERADTYTKFYQWNRETAWTATGTVSDWNSTADQSTTWTINPCPAGWRLPTNTNFTALQNAGYTWATANAKGNARAGKFFGPRNASCTLPNNMAGCIFMPAVGNRNSTGTLASQGSEGDYWSSTQDGATQGRFMSIQLSSNNANNSVSKAYGLTLRCVKNAE